MFENIGGTIKAMAKVFWWIGTITIVGILLIWPFAFVLYGFGELVEKNCWMARNTYKSGINLPDQARKERIYTIERLRNYGLITSEEYKQIIAKEWSGDRYNVDYVQTLSILRENCKNKVITEEEYQEQRAEIISKL